MENIQLKLVPDLFITLVNNPKQPLHARKSFKSKIYLEDYQKALKKVTLLSLSNPVLFNKQNYHRQKGTGTSDSCSTGYRTSSEKFPY